MKTFSATPSDIDKKWILIDADGVVLGRLAAQVAKILRGKHKPTYAPHMDMGDHVVVINAEKVQLTGNKPTTKTYFRHSGYMGGEKHIPFRRMQEKHPERIIEMAVKGMLPKNALGKQMYGKLRVYAGETHPHEAQRPEPLTF